MKITVVTRKMEAGGAERVIAQLLDSWVGSGHECSLILLESTKDFYTVPDRVEIHRIGRVSKNPVADKLGRYAKVRRIVKDIRPDVVLSLPEDIGIYVIGAMMGTGIPVVVSERNDPRSMPNKKITRKLRDILYPLAAGFIFQTEGAASFFPERIRDRGVILPNPLDLSRIPEIYTGEREKVIVGAGRFEKQKNMPLLIDAFSLFYADHPDYKLIIYGDGALRDACVGYALDRLPEESFSFPGKVTDLPQRLSKATAFVLSSDFEGMPNVLIEAMAAGVPSVSTDCPSGGSAAMIEDGKNGLLVPVRDPEAMARAISRLADDPQYAASLGLAAHEICSRLEADTVCGNWAEYLRQTVAERKK